MKSARILMLSSLLAFSNAFAAVSVSDLQTTSKDQKFEDFMKSFDMNSAGNVFEYKNTGTSLGMKVEAEGDKKIKWAPQNAATDVETQVVSYQLGRFLNMSDLVIQSAYYTVTGNALAKFKAMVAGASEKNSLRRENQTKILAALSKNPGSMLGVLTGKGDKAEVKELVNASANTINSSHFLAQAIKSNGPKPSATKMVTFKGVKTKEGKIPTENELELARQFSKVMVLDMLTGQWDRWSGGNLECAWDKKTNKLKFFARDNGGAGMAGTGAAKKYLNIVSRFDRDQIERVKRLGEELQADSAAVASLLQMKSNPKSLKERVQILLDHVKKQEASAGANAYFE